MKRGTAEAAAPKYSVKKLFLKISKIYRKTPVQVQACNFIKTRIQYRCSPMNFAEVLGVTFYRTPPED